MPLVTNENSTLKRHKPVNKKPVVLLIGMLLLAVAAMVGLNNQQRIRDWYILWSYHPPASISDLAIADTMTPYAKSLFYVNRPSLMNKAAFAKVCPSALAQTYELGCYHSGDNGIYLLNVTDSRLNGIDQVTAAYEMLHAGYARLSSASRTKLDRLMNGYYAKNLSSSPVISQQMAVYAKTEPGAKDDELYSVLATEVANLPAYLSAYYRVYFADRAKITTMYQTYQSVLTGRINTINTDAAQLRQLKQQINSEQAALYSDLNTINAVNNQMTSERNQGDFNAYNAAVPGYDQLIGQYKSQVLVINAYINKYNTLLASYNSEVLIQQQLIKAISSQPYGSSSLSQK